MLEKMSPLFLCAVRPISSLVCTRSGPCHCCRRHHCRRCCHDYFRRPDHCQRWCHDYFRRRDLWRVRRQDPCCRHWVVCTFSWLRCPNWASCDLRPLLRRRRSCVLAASQQPVLWSRRLEYSWLSRWGESYLPWSSLLSPGQSPHEDRPEDSKSRQPENVLKGRWKRETIGVGKEPNVR